MNKKVINEVNSLLTKHNLSTIRKFVGVGTLDEQFQLWLLYRKTFKDSPPPKKSQIEVIKSFLEEQLTTPSPKATDRRSQDPEDYQGMHIKFVPFVDELFESLEALPSFFDIPEPILEKQLKKPRPPEYKKYELKQLKQFTFVDNALLQIKDRRVGPRTLIKRSIKIAKILLELFPFRHEIIEVIEPERSATDQHKDPKKVAQKFVNRDENKTPQFNASEISEVMKVARTYIIEHDLSNVYGSVSTIQKEAKHLKGTHNAQKRWIEFYAGQDGIKNKKEVD